MLQLVLDFDPGTEVSSVVVSIKEKLKEQYDMEDIKSMKLIYRGFVLDESKTLISVRIPSYYY